MALGPRHPQVQRLRRLLGHRRDRVAERAFVVEGSTLLDEALAAGAPVEAVFADPGRLRPADVVVLDRARDAGVRIEDLQPGLAERIASTTTPQPVLAVVAMPSTGLDDLALDGLLLVCPDLQDPGNLGTVLRSAEAAGVRGVVCAAGSVDPYNSKCVRASAGALFHIPVVVGDETVQVLEQLSGRGIRLLGTSAREGTVVWDAVLTGPVAVVLGNESHGLGPAVEGRLDGMVRIPITGRAESLNVGVAASVIAFEASRQRRAGAP